MLNLLAQTTGATVSSWDIIVIIIYLGIVGYLGYLGYRRTKTAADFMVAGRQTHPFIMALSYGATFISTSAIVGFGGVAGMFGMSLLWLTFCNIFIGIFLAFVFLGGPTRRMGHRLNAHTFPELIGLRYQSKFIQVFAGLLIFVFIPLYAAAVLIGGCQFLATHFQIQYDVALLVLTVIVAAYVIMGGLKGVMYTDALQGSIMFIGMLILLVVTYMHVGGVVEGHKQLTELGKQPSLFGGIGFKGWTSMPEFGWGAGVGKNDAPNPNAYDLWWIIVSTITLGVGIGVLAQPQLVVRFMTVKSRKQLNRAALVGGVFILIMTGVAFTVGSLSNLYFANEEEITGKIIERTPEGKMDMVIAKLEKGIGKDREGNQVDYKALPCKLIHMDTTGDGLANLTLIEKGAVPPVMPITPKAEIIPLEDGLVKVKPHATAYLRALTWNKQHQMWMANTEAIIPTYIKSAMPKWFGTVFLLTLLAAAMSTLSSQFHALGTAIGRDVFEQVTGGSAKADPNRTVFVVKVGIIIGIVLAVIISYQGSGGYIVARATAIFFGLCASAFLPAFVGGLLFRWVTRGGAIASMLVGFAATAFWLLFIKDKEARALGLCHALTEKHSLLLDHPNWPVVDPICVALPLSLLTLVIVSLMTRKMDEGHLQRCFE
jgi:SSS family solute:Na+ symporter